MSAVVLCLPDGEAARLAASAERYGHRVTASGHGGVLADRVAELRPDAAIADAALLTPGFVDACDRHAVRLIVVGEPAHAAAARAMGIGAVEPGPASWELLGIPHAAAGRVADGAGPAPADAVVAPVRVAPDPVEAVRPSGRGRIVAVWGAAGAPGRTSLAIALAAEYAATGVAVALADADTHAASVAPALGLLDESPGFAAACRLAGLGTLSAAELDRLATPVPGPGAPLRVLSGIGRPNRWPEIGVDRVSAVLGAARDWAEVTVVDVAAPIEQDEELSTDAAAPRRNGATLAVLRDADEVLVVGAADPIGLARLLHARADAADLLPPGKARIVVNKVRSSAIGIDPGGQVRQTLARFAGVADPALVPWDPAAFDAALLSGRPLRDAAPRSAARAAIRRLVA